MPKKFSPNAIELPSHSHSPSPLMGEGAPPPPPRDPLDILRRLNTAGLCMNLEAPASGPASFDWVLVHFLEEVSRRGGSPPFPVVIGDDCHVDLLKLFCVVCERGGYSRVTSDRSWPEVSESAGLEPELSPLVKLVYVKYLLELEKRIYKDLVKNKNSDCRNGHFVTNGGNLTQLKRKREATMGMLNWIKNLAKNPCDLSYNISSFIKGERGKTVKSKMQGEYFSLSLSIRKELFAKKISKDYADKSPKQRGQKSCPTNGECSTPTTRSKEKTRGTPPNTELTSELGLAKCTSWLSVDHDRTEIPVGRTYQAYIPPWTGKPSDLPPSDPQTLKFVGTKIWSPSPIDNKNVIASSIGKGRTDKKCDCQLPGSVECVRFHIAESRLELKRELGPTFYYWGLHKMGEEISLAWTEEEEREFKSIVRTNPPSMDKNYWDLLYVKFGYKRRREVVRYYFNVFLLRRRSYQNRVTPNKVDSDDEESEFGLLGSPFGHDAIRFRDWKGENLFCSQNSQCVNLDDQGFFLSG